MKDSLLFAGFWKYLQAEICTGGGGHECPLSRVTKPLHMPQLLLSFFTSKSMKETVTVGYVVFMLSTE